MKPTIDDIVDRLEKQALKFEEGAAREDQKGADRRLHLIRGEHIAAQAMRDIVRWLKEQQDLGAEL